MRLLFLLIILLSLQFCNTYDKAQIDTKKIQVFNYTGWWIYGENLHLFKDKESLEEWELFFINEDIEYMTALFLEVAEMEYFPLECIMKGSVFEKNNKKILEVSEFEILHIQGCDQ